tara:strand:+ start:1719 stop:1925 length:207 start_codon:yes stop_codon:yes gene_type:complete
MVCMFAPSFLGRTEAPQKIRGIDFQKTPPPINKTYNIIYIQAVSLLATAASQRLQKKVPTIVPIYKLF